LYLPKSHPVHSYKAAIRAAFIEAAGKWRTITGPVRLSVVAKFAMPASWSKKQTEATAGAVCMKTPDHDNIAKSVSDALTDCGVWQDDRQVVVSLVSKYWSEQPQTEITIEELPWNG
jgi:Holliday junction resolvase RusA-like endonuclease